MKMTLNELQKHYNDLSKLGKSTFPVKLSFAIRRNMEKMETEIKLMEKERLDLCRRFADRDEFGDPVLVDSVVNGSPVKEFRISSGKQELLNEMEALFDSEVEIDIVTVPEDIMEQCERSEKYTIPSVEEIRNMSFMIAE